MNKLLTHAGFTLELDRVTVVYELQKERFTRAGTSNNVMYRYGYEYKISNCDLSYNTSKLLKDWKYMIENLKQYQWLVPYLKSV